MFQTDEEPPAPDHLSDSFSRALCICPHLETQLSPFLPPLHPLLSDTTEGKWSVGGGGLLD